jgi:hypothetical protein
MKTRTCRTLTQIVTLTLAATLALNSPQAGICQISALKQAATTQKQATNSEDIPPSTGPTDPMGVLTECLLYGEETDWRGSASPQGYLLQSKSGPGEIKYFYHNTRPELEGKRTLGLHFMVQGPGSAGLIYGLNLEQQRYYLILVDETATLRILARTPDGFSEMLSTSVQASAPFDLQLQEQGQDVHVSLNGHKLLSFSNEWTGRGGIGIAALGSGNYAFRSFSLK